MSHRLYRALQSLVLVLLGLYLFNKLIDGSLFWYISARFMPLTVVGAVGLIWLARTLLGELRAGNETQTVSGAAPADHPAHDPAQHAGTGSAADDSAAHQHSHRSPAALFILAVPFLLGVLVPARPLGASAIENKGFSAVAPLQAAGAGTPLQLELAPADRNVQDWLRAFNQSADPNQYAGQPADLIGFVYHDPRLPNGQFLLGRFTLTCCVADAAAIGVIVEWPRAAELPTNGWVRVSGAVQVGQLEGDRIPLIEADSIEAVPEPAQPYLFN